MEYKDYYKVMGVARDATEAQIKQAYRKLARKYHPDVSKEKDAEARFKEVGEAYEVLKSPDKRAAYDQLGQGQPGQDFRPGPGRVAVGRAFVMGTSKGEPRIECRNDYHAGRQLARGTGRAPRSFMKTMRFRDGPA